MNDVSLHMENNWQEVKMETREKEFIEKIHKEMVEFVEENY